MKKNKHNIKKRNINIQELISNIEARGLKYNKENIYLLPEIFGKNEDILNEQSPNIKKDLLIEGFESFIVKNEKYRFHAVRSVEIILPIIMGMPFSVFANFITDWIKGKTSSNDTLKIRYANERNDICEIIEIEGNKEGVLEALRIIKNEQ